MHTHLVFSRTGSCKLQAVLYKRQTMLCSGGVGALHLMCLHNRQGHRSKHMGVT